MKFQSKEEIYNEIIYHSEIYTDFMNNGNAKSANKHQVAAGKLYDKIIYDEINRGMLLSLMNESNDVCRYWAAAECLNINFETELAINVLTLVMNREENGFEKVMSWIILEEWNNKKRNND